MGPESSLEKGKEPYGKVFGLAFLAMALVLVPLLCLDGGLMLYYGDFCSQQLPFYVHANEVVRSGGLTGWDWGTDLGSSFLGSYAFYLAGSPFFWLTTLLPEGWVLYAIPWLLCLKHAVAALTAYAYIRRFTRTRTAAMTGALLYAFSGFQAYNIFFNHFQDVTAFFPLLLLALEDLIHRNRRGWFGVWAALMGILNYFFFAGQVVFVLLYFAVRAFGGEFPVTWRKFLALAIEAICGVAIACIVLLPAALAVAGNSRVSNALYGQDMVLYSDKTRIAHIVQSFFMIPDPPARPNLFDTSLGKWSSIGGYLPLFSMVGVITFMREHRFHWAKTLTWICIVCAFVPILNSMFYMFNSSYYARWYYMPILVMAMMTSQVLEDEETDWRPGIIACGAVLLVLVIISLLPTKNDDGEVEWFSFANNFPYFLITAAVSVLCLFGTYGLFEARQAGKAILRPALWMTSAACVACTASIVWFGRTIGPGNDKYKEEAIDGAEHLSISYETDTSDYFRVDVSEDYDNYPMFWGLSSIRCFQSVVDPSIMEFYQSIGEKRDVASRPDPERYTLRGLFSVKYYFDRIREDEEEFSLPGFSLYGEENGFRIYQNDYFIPMGFPYDTYITQEAFEERGEKARDRVLIRALVLDEKQAARYADILADASGSATFPVSESAYLQACEAHREEACRDFRYDAHGFSAKIDLAKPELVFFSVPWESGWTAEVNGTPVEVERVSEGFMAVRCEAGESEIVFHYTLPGMHAGVGISLLGVLGLLLYLWLGKRLLPNEPQEASWFGGTIEAVNVRSIIFKPKG